MKRFIIIFVSLFIINQSFAQDQFYLGLKAGIGFSFEKFYDEMRINQNTGLKYNFNGGAELNIILSEDFSLESEMIFEDKGIKLASTNIGQVKNENITMGYIQFPELIRYTLNIKGENKIKPFVELGFDFADRLFTSVVVKDEGPFNYSQNITANENSYLNRFEWGITGGFGAVKNIGRGFVSINIRFDYSVVNNLQNPIFSGFDPVTNTFVSVKQSLLFSVLSFGINYTYPLKLDKNHKKTNLK